MLELPQHLGTPGDIRAVVLNLIASALSSLCGRVFGGLPTYSSADAVVKTLEEEPSLAQVIQHTVAKVASLETFQEKDAIRAFLVSQDCECILRHILSQEFSGNMEDRESSRRQFLESFGRYISDNRDPDHANFASLTFEALVEAARAITVSVWKKHHESVWELANGSRHALVVNKLNKLEAGIQNLAVSVTPEQETQFLENYRRVFKEKYSWLSPPHTARETRVAFDSLFVAPELSRQTAQRSTAAEIIRQYTDRRNGSDRLTRDQLLDVVHRVVILGDPGGGKTTLAQSICLSCLSSRRGVGRRRLTPIFVVLRQYGEYRKSARPSILDFIVDHCSLQTNLTLEMLTSLLVTGQLMIAFDGLDELLDIAQRREIRDDIAAFCSLHTDTPVVVTSRRIGYENAPLNEDTFYTFSVGRFGEREVRQYSDAWFSIQSELSEAESAELSARFHQQSESVGDIRGNPLMLALMCGLYRHDRYLPENRPEVYEKCAEWLFERWDTSRGIFVKLDFDYFLRPLVCELARTIYNRPALQEGITERELIKLATRFLCPARIEEPANAETAARSLIAHCYGRSWVFTDTGSTDDEALFQFTHRTFLEYFTGVGYSQQHESMRELYDALREMLHQRSQDVVCQIAIHLKCKASDPAVTTFLTILCEDAIRWPIIGPGLVSFGLRMLTVLAPPAKELRQLVSLGIRFYCQDAGSSVTGEYVPALLEAREETYGVVASSVAVSLMELATADVSLASAVAVNSLLSPRDFFGFENDSSSNSVRNAITAELKEVATGCAELDIKTMSRIYSPLAVTAYQAGYLSVEEVLEMHPAEELFPNRGYFE